ncbi:MAG: amidohydrolase [Acidobacteria bacterium]|nr:amidohydrolase [Acidobacteriota bacterium]MDW7984971.1 amidohydrolase [Acidobacteriota bacterium]
MERRPKPQDLSVQPYDSGPIVYRLWSVALTLGGLMAFVGVPPMETSRRYLLPPPADVLLVGGRVYPLWPTPDAVVSAVAIRQGRIAALGSDEELRAWRGPRTRVIDLRGATALPGLTDAHVHLASLGRLRRQLVLTGTRSKEEVLQRLRTYARRHPNLSWIVGRGWDQNDWPDPHMPDRADLDRVVPDRPVYLIRIDGHAAWVNTKALEQADIGPASPDPPGGRILRRPDGSPTGVLLDRAAELVQRVMPEPTVEDLMADLEAGARACTEVGLTGVHDAGISPATWAAYVRLVERDRLPIRVYAMAMYRSGLDEQLLTEGPLIGLGDGRLTLRAIKVLSDGALGSRGAALLEPYADEPDSTGLLLVEPDELVRLARRALDAGVQLAVHAIGDRANRMVLDAFEVAFRERPCGDCRFRIEHAQVVHPQDIPRLARLGVVPSMQPTHATSDMPWAPDRLGPDRLQGAYAWRSILQTGLKIAGGSDAPVEEISPLLGLYAAVTRQDLQGRPAGGWRPEERVTPQEALQMFTQWAAYAAFEEFQRGTLRPGTWADLTVLDGDPFQVEPRQIPHLRVRLTMVGGRIVYE